MPTTTNSGLRYPASSNAPNIPVDFQNLANDVDSNMPRGEIAYGERFTTAGPASNGAGWVTVSQLQVSVTLASARKVKVTMQGQATSNVAGTTVGTRIINLTTSDYTAITTYIQTANGGEGIAITLRQSLAAGSYSFAIQQCWFGGGGGAYLTADRSSILVEDIGHA